MQMIHLRFDWSCSKGQCKMSFYSSGYFGDEQGASAVEFALIAPVIIMLFVVTIDLGFLMRDKMQLQNAVFSIADYVAQAQSADNLNQVAAEVYNDDAGNVDFSAEFTCACSDGIVVSCPVTCIGDGDYQRRYVTVSGEGTFDTLFPYPGTFDSMDFSSSARVRVD